MSDDVAAVLAAEERRAEALVRGDAEALRSVLHPAFRWTTYLGRILDRDAYVAGNTDGRLRWLAQSRKDLHIAVVGDAAVLGAIVTDEVEQDGTPRTYRLPMTQTWVRTPDGWRCLSGHAGPDRAG